MKRKKGIIESDLTERFEQSAEHLSQMAQLEKKPAFLAMEQRRQENIKQHKLATAPIVGDLKGLGFSVESVDQLRRSGIRYESAIPVLLKWLPRVTYEWGVKESIVRTLSVPWAKPTAGLPLIAEYRRAPEPLASGLKWAIGNALSVIADDGVFNEIAELVRDKRHGKAREMLAVALGNMTDPRAIDLAIELLNDDDVAGHALIALGKLKARKARPSVQRLLTHQKAWVRKEAKKVLARLDK